jgi:hypothetical protein
MKDTWFEYFQNNVWPAMPWADPYRLSPEETAAVAHSIQQFQLGEGSEGNAFIQRARLFASASGDPEFVPTLQLFIKEEQRHSSNLGRFMDLHGIPHLKKHWLDQIFRRMRCLAALELIVTVLVTAEIVAVPYYRALHNATRSPLLRALCRQILLDEAAHLQYQAATLGRLRSGRSAIRRALTELFHAFLLNGTVLAVWMEHRRVFLRGRYTLAMFLKESECELSAVQQAGYPTCTPNNPASIQRPWTCNSKEN